MYGSSNEGNGRKTISAAVTGNYNKALHAFTINPLVPSGEIAKELLNEMLLAHKKHLPQFKETIEKRLVNRGIKNG